MRFVSSRFMSAVASIDKVLSALLVAAVCILLLACNSVAMSIAPGAVTTMADQELELIINISGVSRATVIEPQYSLSSPSRSDISGFSIAQPSSRVELKPGVTNQVPVRLLIDQMQPVGPYDIVITMAAPGQSPKSANVRINVVDLRPESVIDVSASSQDADAPIFAGGAVRFGGNTYLSDTFGNKLYKLSPLGDLSVFAGSGDSGSADGYRGQASFSGPRGLAVDSDGFIYVADSQNHLIRKVSPDGNVTTIAGSGVNGFKDGWGTKASFSYPTDVAINRDASDIYVADSQNRRIRKVTKDGRVTVLAGSGEYGSFDGSWIKSKFVRPTALDIDLIGNVYVVDAGAIRKISRGLSVTTIAGASEENFSSKNANGVSSRFSLISDIAVDSEGHLYASQAGDGGLRLVSTDGYASTVSALGCLALGVTLEGGIPYVHCPYAIYRLASVL